jgi:hypothetical protein
MTSRVRCPAPTRSRTEESVRGSVVSKGTHHVLKAPGRLASPPGGRRAPAWAAGFAHQSGAADGSPVRDVKISHSAVETPGPRPHSAAGPSHAAKGTLRTLNAPKGTLETPPKLHSRPGHLASGSYATKPDRAFKINPPVTMAAPTHSRGRPALPVYWPGVTGAGCYWWVVDNFAPVDKGADDGQ